MSGLNESTAFYEDKDKKDISTEVLYKPESPWSCKVIIRTLSNGTINLHMSELQFIKIKNAFLELDRTIEEEKKAYAPISKRT